MSEPEVDVVIAVHAPERPVERAIASVLHHTEASVRVTVVIHNTDPVPIRDRVGALREDPRLRFIEHRDAFRTPAGPKNKGLSLATAPFVAMLDSDDSLEPGALDAWLRAARLPGGVADAVIAPTANRNGGLDPSPPVRWTRIVGRLKPLNPVRDRLAYRASPLGLIGRARFSKLRFAEGIPTGEDQPVTAALWFTPGSRIVFPLLSPRYLEHHDQADRVTGTRRSVEQEFLSLDVTLEAGTEWARHPEVRLSLALKLLRVHVFDAARNRVGVSWDGSTAVQLASVARRVLDWEPRARMLLARADEDLLDAILEPSSPEARLAELLRARALLRSSGALLPKRLRYALHPQAPLRFHLAAAMLARFARR